MKKIIIIFIGIIAGSVLIIALANYFTPNATNGGDTPPVADVSAILTGPKNISYLVDGNSVLLVNGKAEKEVAPGSASKEKFALFGEPTYGDLDGDGDLDAVTYLTRDGGGSGTFFYVVVAVNEMGTYKGTDAMFLGDRMTPQNISIEKGKAVANFAERKVGEPFSVQPSVGKSVFIHLDSNKYEIGEAVQNFEGEVDISKIDLQTTEWKWIRTDYTDGNKIVPKQVDKFVLTFRKDSTFSAKTDCNSIGGKYISRGVSLTFSDMISTRMFCEGSQEGEFSAMLADVSSYHFTNKGELMLELKDKKGAITLR